MSVRVNGMIVADSTALNRKMEKYEITVKVVEKHIDVEIIPDAGFMWVLSAVEGKECGLLAEIRRINFTLGSQNPWNNSCNNGRWVQCNDHEIYEKEKGYGWLI